MARIVPEPYEPEPDFEDDPQLKEFAGHWTRLITAPGPPLALVLDAPWGSGKTTFIQRWGKDYAAKGGVAAYVDLASCLIDDNLVLALCAALLEAMEQVGCSHPTASQDRLQRLAGLAVRAAAALAGAGQLAELLQKAWCELNDDGTDDKDVAKIIARRNVFRAFREQLSELARQTRQETGSPLVLIIDEFDRTPPARAIAAVRLLHELFDMEGVVRVLVADSAQLARHVEHEYGRVLTPERFLHKYVDYVARLPVAGAGERGLDWYKGQVRTFRRRYDLAADEAELGELATILHFRQATFRDMERIFSRIALVDQLARSMRPNVAQGYYRLVVVLAAVYVLEPGLYAELERLAREGVGDAVDLWSRISHAAGWHRTADAWGPSALGSLLGVSQERMQQDVPSAESMDNQALEALFGASTIFVHGPEQALRRLLAYSRAIDRFAPPDSEPHP